MAEATGRRRRAGRPRLRPAVNANLSAREEILDAAASLFVTGGFAATATRQIAGRVGIQQASLYYYFGSKDEILLELLTESVRPSLEVARFLESRCGGDPAAGLYALALIDVRTLTSAPHNIATLYLLPEVQGPEFASFRAERVSRAPFRPNAGTWHSGIPGTRPLGVLFGALFAPNNTPKAGHSLKGLSSMLARSPRGYPLSSRGGLTIVHALAVVSERVEVDPAQRLGYGINVGAADGSGLWSFTLGIVLLR